MALDLANPFADLLPASPTPETDGAIAEAPQLIGGGTADAPAFQVVGGKMTDVPRGVAVSTTDYGPFSDLVSSGPAAKPINNYTEQFGMFADLVPPSSTPETDAAVEETGWKGFLQGLDLASVPRDLLLNMAGPLPDAIHDLHATYDWLSGKKTLQEAFPETQQLVGIEKKPLQERIKTGLDTLLNLAFAKGIGEGVLPRKPVRPTQSPEAAGGTPEAAPSETQPSAPVGLETRLPVRVEDNPFADLIPKTGGETDAISQQSAGEMGAHQGGDQSLGGQVESGGVGQGEQGQEVARASQVPPQEVASVPIMITRQMEADLRARGFGDADINKMTPAEAHEILSSTQAQPAPEGGEPVAPGREQTPAPVAAPPLAAEQAAEEERLRREAEAEMQQQFESFNPAQEIGGHTELYDAIEDAGGFPFPDSPNAEGLRGELAGIHESAKQGRLPDEKGYYNRRIFRKDAGPVSRVVDHLQELGFPVEGASDVFDLVRRRMEGKPIYGNAATADVAAEYNDWTGATRLGAVPSGTAQLQQAGAAIAGVAKQVGKAATTLKPFHDYRRARLNWSARNQASTGEIYRAARDIVRVAPKQSTREGITNWIQAKGDTAELQRRLAATKKLELKRGYEAALRLTPEQKALAGKISQTYEILRQRAERYGIQINRLEDYVNQIWKKSPLSFLPRSSRRLNTNVRFAKQRFYDSFFHGEQAGLTPETKDIGKLLPIYMQEINNAISSKQFVEEMAKGVASDGRPLLAPRGGGTVLEPSEGKKGVILAFPDAATKDTLDYQPLEQPALHQWKWIGEENGKPILLKGDLAVHPDLPGEKIYGHLKNVLGQSHFREWYLSESDTGLQHIGKRAVKFLLDDVQQVGKATMLGFLSPFHQVQEGTHAIGHRVNPFGGLEKIDLRKPNQMDAAVHGLMLLPDRISEQQFREGLDGSTRNLLANVIGKLGGKPGAKIKEWADGYQHYLFHQYIPALKLKTYEHILPRNMARFDKELKSGAATLDQIKFLTAEQANAAYGHLNYADLGRNPTIQHMLQTFLLAPDFLEARTRFAGQSISGAVSKVGREQFAALATLAATQWILARVLNKTLDDDYHFDEPFGVIVGNRRYTMRSVPEDIYKAFTDTRRFISGRLSPLIGRGLLEGLSGVNYRSEPTTIGETLTNILSGMVPISMQPFTRGLSETGRDNPVSPFEQFLGSIGLHVSRFSPVSKVYKLSKDWVDQHGKEYGIQPDRGIYPRSKYQQLRYALEDGNFEQAKIERDKLIAAGEKPSKVTSGFRESINHPFTGSQVNDRRFKKSLSPEDQQLYDAAIKRRREILRRYGLIPK